MTRTELLEKWDRGWAALSSALRELTDADLSRTITIRKQALPIHEALHRSLAHASYHVGQMVYLAKSIRSGDWQCLSIPRGESEVYNANPNPARERPTAHAWPLERDVKSQVMKGRDQ